MKRPEGEPPPQRTLWEKITRRGRDNLPEFIQQWKQFAISEKQREREEIARQRREKEEQERREQRQWKLHEQEQAQLKQRVVRLGNEICQKLVEEMEAEGLKKFAEEVIKKTLWKNKQFTAISISQVNNPDVLVKDDGTIIRCSRSGIKISYRHKALNPSRVEESLYFGIGYFGNRTEIIPEAQGSVTYGNLQKGVKGYFVEVDSHRSYTGQRTTVFPYAYSDHREAFYLHLYESAKHLSPDQVIPQERRHIKEANKTWQAYKEGPKKPWRDGRPH